MTYFYHEFTEIDVQSDLRPIDRVQQIERE
jgi:hypothetical protein